MNDSSKAKDALTRIIEIANHALDANGSPEYKAPPDTKTNEGNVQDSAYVGCSIRALPDRLQKKAADMAMRINPANAPIMETVSGMAADVISDPMFLTILTSKYWGPTPRRLAVSFMEPTPADLKSRIISHMNAWTKTCCISFVETAGTGHIRISRAGSGYWSYLGTDVLQIPANRPTMNLQNFSMNTPEREFIRVVRHETGHTLGFPHEHMRRELVNRIDPQKAYDYFWRTQGWDKAMVDRQVLTPLDERTIYGTPADQTSIMCYHLPASITRDGQPIWGGADINATDYAYAGRCYPKPSMTFTAQKQGVSAGDEWSESDDVPDNQVESMLRESVPKFNGIELAG